MNSKTYKQSELANHKFEPCPWCKGIFPKGKYHCSLCHASGLEPVAVENPELPCVGERCEIECPIYKLQLGKVFELCLNCGMDWTIRNPSGKCDHLYFPDYLDRNAKRGIGKFLPIRCVKEGDLSEVYVVKIG